MINSRQVGQQTTQVVRISDEYRISGEYTTDQQHEGLYAQGFHQISGKNVPRLSMTWLQFSLTK